MKNSIWSGFFLLCLWVNNISASGKEGTEKTIERLRHEFSTKRSNSSTTTLSADSVWELIDSQGRFLDKRQEEVAIESGKFATSNKMAHCIRINNLARDCFERLQVIAETYRGQKQIDVTDEKMQILLRGILFYGKMENERKSDVAGRFHASCFATPRASVNIYFSLLDLMNRVEKGEVVDSLTRMARQKLVDVGFQSWTQPYRHDETDKNIISVERFRKHVWWVGGNALGYRPVLEAAVMMKSVAMLDVLVEVALKSFSVVSQTTYDEAFWTEGTTADGAGWGHGKQCLVWGYPIDGLEGAFCILKHLQGSRWVKTLPRQSIEVVMNYIRGSAFYHHRGVIPPLLDRGNMIWRSNYRGKIPAHVLAQTLLTDWHSDLNDNEKNELEQFVCESSAYHIRMESAPDGNYHGTRYFYNNDDLIKKTDDYYLFVNMASFRVDGLESAYPMAAGYNFYAADGVTLFQKEGQEYRNILGAMKLTAWPGVTTRQMPTPLLPIENWSGFTSKHNFAAGATDGKGDFAAGFIYQKINARLKETPDVSEAKDSNKDIFGVQAYKSYFMFDDLFVALGAGITNLQPEKEGDVTTTIEQTHSLYPPVGWQQSDSVLVQNKKGAITWIRHGGFTYGVLPEYTTGEVQVSREVRVTNWARLCKVNTEKETKVPVFQMEINHGRQAKNATYAYMVQCSEVEVTELPKILSNTTHLQAVQSADAKRLGAVFFESSAMLRGEVGSFSVSAPVALLVQKKKGKLQLTVTDARMDKALDFLVVKTTIPIKGKEASRLSGGWYELKIALPAEPHRGKPCTVEVAIN